MAKSAAKPRRQQPLSRERAQQQLEQAIDRLAPLMTNPDVPSEQRKMVHHVIGKLVKVLSRLPKH